MEEYLAKHGLQDKIEALVNEVASKRVDDPLAYLGKALLKQSSPTILGVKARQVFDSRGNPTIETELTTHKGTFRAMVPSGASTGVHEAVELRDGDKAKYLGKGVSKAVSNVNDIIAPAIIGKDPTAQAELDQAMIDLDGTDNKAKLGANAILSVSMALCKAAAAEKGVPVWRYIADLAGNKQPVLPVPSFNVINGGVHAGNGLPMQEFMILPVGASNFVEAMRMGTEVYHNLKALIKEKYGIDAANVGDEGGFAPNINTGEAALDLLTEAIEKAGYTGKVKIGMDPASSEFYDEASKTYDLQFKLKDADGSGKITSAELIKVYQGFLSKYDIIFIEDPCAEDDWDGFVAITKAVDVEIIGDDLLVTNPKRIAKAIELKACNGLLLKVNQIGTITESIQAVKMAKAAGWGVLASHRSGETEDAFLADISVALSVGHLKTGAPCRSERLCKYNQLLRIEEEMGADAVYAGDKWRFIAIE